MNQFAQILGRRLRARRRLLGLTQAAVGEASGLTFQQIHKCENGTTMISASRLWRLANALDVPISYFFDGLPSGVLGGGKPVKDPEPAVPLPVAQGKS